MKHKYWLIASIFGIAILPISSFWINSLLDSSTANLARAAIYISISATIIYQKKQRTLPLFTSIGSLKNHRLSILFTLLILLTMKLVDISVNKIYSAQNWNENLLIEKEHKHLLENGFIPIERELDSAYAGSKKYLKIENKQITYKFLVCSKDIVGGFHDPIYCLTASGFDVVKSHLTKKNGHTENQIIARSEGKKSLFQYYYQTINEKHPNLFWAKFQERIYNFSFGMIGSPVIMILTEIK